MLYGNPSHIGNPETVGIVPSAIYTIAMLPEGNVFHSTSTSPAPGWKSEAFDVLQQLYLDSGGDFVAWLWPWFIAILLSKWVMNIVTTT